MKIKEAIELIKQKQIIAGRANGKTLQNDFSNTVIAALEKQIAKKPINGATFKHIGKCPDCNQTISTRSASNNCQYCGQKIDWRFFD